MGNNSKNIIKISVDGNEVRKAIAQAGYSIHSISKKIGFSDRSIRSYLNRNEIPVPMLDAILTETSKDHTDYAVDASVYEICAKNDNVNHPGHYTFGEIEVIDYIRDKMTPDEFQGYCMGNILKYVSRHKHKNGVEDLKKAQVYLGWLIESEEGTK